MCAVVGVPTGFVVREPITAIDPSGHGSSRIGVVGPAAPHLGREVVGMGVVIALGAPIGGQLFEGLEPGIDGRMLVAQSIPLVVSQ